MIRVGWRLKKLLPVFRRTSGLLVGSHPAYVAYVVLTWPCAVAAQCARRLCALQAQARPQAGKLERWTDSRTANRSSTSPARIGRALSCRPVRVASILPSPYPP